MTKVYTQKQVAARAGRNLLAAGKAPTDAFKIVKADGGFAIDWIWSNPERAPVDTTVDTTERAEAVAAQDAAETSQEVYAIDPERLAAFVAETIRAPELDAISDAKAAACEAALEAGVVGKLICQDCDFEVETVNEYGLCAACAAPVVSRETAPVDFTAVKRAADIKAALDMGMTGDRKSARAAVEKLHRLGADVPADLIAKAKDGGKSRAARAAKTADGLREGSKKQLVLDLVKRPEGATEAEVCEALGGWKRAATTIKRTIRAAGFTVATAKDETTKRARYFAR